MWDESLLLQALLSVTRMENNENASNKRVIMVSN